MSNAALHGAAFGRSLTDLVDDELRALLGDDTGSVAVVALGSYGRRDLCPASDLDVLLVHEGHADVADVARRLWYPIWDAGLALDHSVRTARETLSVANDDLRAALGLLDARVVAGDAASGLTLPARAREQWSRRGPKWLTALASSAADRHERAGEVAFLLEPQLKEGKGGLRDAVLLSHLALAVPVVGPGQADVVAARETLLDVRIELHREAGRRLDTLLLQHQDQVAERLGCTSADELMARVAHAGRVVAWAWDDAWSRIRSFQEGPRRRTSPGRERPIGSGIVLRDGAVDLASATTDIDDAMPLRLAAAAAYAGAPIAPSALERVAESAPVPTEPWTDATRHAFLALLGSGHAVVPAFETLDHCRLVERYLPEWATVRSRPQRNALHRYTVDRHLLECVAEAGSLTRDVSRPDLLLLGALLHDIGKGSPGDHTEAGVVLAETVTHRMGFPDGDVRAVSELVRLHLLLPSIATSRDLDDPKTIRSVADAVQTVETLDLLAALTEADSIATGTGVWTRWKAELVDHLVRRVHDALGGTEGDAAEWSPEPAYAALLERAAGGLLVEAEGNHLRIVGPDRPGFLAAVVGLLTLHGQSVLAARAWSDEAGTAVDELDVEPVFDRQPDWEAFREELTEVLAGRRLLGAAIEERERRYPARPSALGLPDPRVIVHHDASDRATVVEVRAADFVGLLYHVTRAISEHGLDIRLAKVQTLGHEAVDTFYLRSANRMPLSTEEAEVISQAITTVLAGRTPSSTNR